MTGTFTDRRDGERYKTVQLLDGKEWFAENLRFNCVDSISVNPEWLRRQRLSHYTTYDPHAYGRLYTWEAAQAACPPGWRVPSAGEWRNMLSFYGGFLVGNDARDAEKEGAISQLQQAGFNVMPGPFDGVFHWDHSHDLEQAQFWSSSTHGLLRRLNPFAGPSEAAYYFLFAFCVVEHVDICSFRLSVRCVR
jgi:uncharacterized protein (TIGR02145 family)